MSAWASYLRPFEWHGPFNLFSSIRKGGLLGPTFQFFLLLCFRF
jgi:hypothetical protein